MTLSPSTKFAVAVKPLLWSLNGYDGPSSPRVAGGFVRKHGFGGEEWNGRSDRTWKGQRVFHTETKEKLDLYAKHGHLGLLMIAMHDDVQYIVGVACGVRINEEDDLASIFKQLAFKNTINELWNASSVRARYASIAALKKDFPAGFDAPRWRCPSDYFHWFEEPVPLPKDPLGFGKEVLAKMHNNYQAIRPEHALKLLDGHLPPESLMRQWFIEAEFDEAFLPRSVRSKPGQTSSERADNFGAPAAKDPYTRYIQEKEIRVTPEHHLLEKAFLVFLRTLEATAIAQNKNAIDVRFELKTRGHIIAELKPAVAGQTKYPIRFAVGQVLEYRHFQTPNAHPLIVLGTKPKPEEIKFCQSLGISVAWKTTTSFVVQWAE
ncbi:hypothetical protein [Mesorhizobium sp. B1-1-8]|uniref:hypothetical protein n=1 Tax=Mesorhizobium sp. B1-1-8 TaxID=2589976 RepID=UPI00112E812D|nr:hypothetical protein [Mesorhizobium sp. B1-1-8]UCI05209.1 hypothetical protein FJ974_15185 [Mesorhizobium sp. B1-1-8]